MSKAGVFAFVGGSMTGDFTVTGSAADIFFDVSDDELMFQDDAVLSFGDTADITVIFDGGDLDILGDGLEIAIGATGAGLDVFLWGQTGNYAHFDEDNDYLYFEDYSLRINEGGNLEFGFSDDAVDWTIDNASAETLVILPTETDGTQTLNFGSVTNTTDVRIFGETASTVVFDADADLVTYVAYSILLDDTSTQAFGTGADFTVYSDTANTLEFDPATAGNTIKFGTADTDAVDMIWYSDVSGDTVTFNEENATVEFEDVSLALGDLTKILFGDTIATGDIKMYANGTELVIDGVVAETGTISIGLTDLGIDFKLWAATNAEGVLWDASDERLEFVGAGIILDGPGLLIDAMDESGTKIDVGTPVYFIFNPTVGEELNYTVPTGYDLLILDAWGFKTAAAGVGGGDQWDIQNNSTNSIFAVSELAGVADKERVQFDDLVDTEYEIEAGETLTLVAGEDADDDGADGIITVVGMYKVAD
jgi:hypothetical protein